MAEFGKYQKQHYFQQERIPKFPSLLSKISFTSKQKVQSKEPCKHLPINISDIKISSIATIHMKAITLVKYLLIQTFPLGNNTIKGNKIHCRECKGFFVFLGSENDIRVQKYYSTWEFNRKTC